VRASRSKGEPESAIQNQESREEKMGKTILVAVLVAIVVGGVAGFGGYKMGDSAGFQRANQVRQEFAQTRQGGQGGMGQGGMGGLVAGGGNRAFELQGAVKSVDGNTMVVTIGQRDVTVTLTDKTQFLKSVAGARTDLAAGARVMVAPEGGNAGGAGGAGAAMNAASVTVLPAQ
jgi:hypothetical protein